jgi:hypothetical protein
MALLFMDSFDHYVTADLLEKWSSQAGTVAISAANGRRSSASLRLATAGAQLYKTCGTANTTIIVGAAVRASLASNPASLFTIWEATAVRNQVILAANPDGSLAAYRGPAAASPGAILSATLLGTIPAALAANSYAYVELRVVLHESAGEVQVRVNGVQLLNLTAQDTIATGATASWTSLLLSTNNGVTTVDYDDLYVLDGSGPAPWNTFLGDCRVDARVPTAPGATTGWTPLAGANWAAVDDTAPDDDTTYTSTSTLNAVDTFVVQDAPVAGATLFGVQHCLNLKKTDAGACTVAPVVRHSGVDNVGTAISPGTSYAYGLAINQTNPGTSAQWTEAEFNAAEFGYTRTA